MWDQRFEEILRGRLPFLTPDEDLVADLNLRDHGLDSLGIVDLVGALEAAYEVSFRDGALTVENFETPAILWKTLSGLADAARG
ncbi:acyl carrier protein [Streptomyces caatingaensis]|uniref:Phosphopantetheine-binding protein n=1 Tax=Streptomyces caatingaensis TaxID=1678637 RepID=A0A0K9XCU7_9ACTN|nr:acyl carrier protein [Streptomyces caatingaensis]KNB50961.1 phosphopantetheine-binding protein [Streptomyces caatingaensis]